jgi:hypothetical protein
VANQPPAPFDFAGHFGSARMTPYLHVCRQDADLAEELYRWNARAAAAFWIDLGHLEVPYRNAVDRRLRLWHERKGRAQDWLDDPEGVLGRDRYGRGRHSQP